MKEYFNKEIPNLYEWVQMKRIGIKVLTMQGKSIPEICEIVNLNRQNVWRNKKLEIDSDIEHLFAYHVHRNLYPVKHKTKIKWIQITQENYLPTRSRID